MTYSSDRDRLLATVGLRYWKATICAGIIAATVPLIVQTPIVWLLTDLL